MDNINIPRQIIKDLISELCSNCMTNGCSKCIVTKAQKYLKKETDIFGYTEDDYDENGMPYDLNYDQVIER